MSPIRTLAGSLGIVLVMSVAGCGGGAPPTLTVPQGHADEAGNVPMPDGFPSDVPRYPGARVAATSSIHPAISATLETDDDRAKVVSFYTGKLPAQGWVVEQQKEEEGALLIHARKGGQPLSVEVAAANGKTRISLKYTPKEE